MIHILSDRRYIAAHRTRTGPHLTPEHTPGEQALEDLLAGASYDAAHIDALTAQVANLQKMLDAERAKTERLTRDKATAHDTLRGARARDAEMLTASAAAGRPTGATVLWWLRRIEPTSVTLRDEMEVIGEAPVKTTPKTYTKTDRDSRRIR